MKPNRTKTKNLIKKLKELDSDPKLKEESERHYREISILSEEDLFRRFTI